MKKYDLNFMYRKTINKNLYIFSKLFDEIMDYEEYKEVVYNNKTTTYKYFKYLNNIKKCLTFLINKAPIEITIETINNLYALLFNKDLKEEQIFTLKGIEKEKDYLKLMNNFMQVLKENNDYERYSYAFVIINYLLMIDKQKIYRYNIHFFKKMYSIITKTLDYELLIKEINLIVEKGLTLDVEYYENLQELSSKDIEKILLDNKEQIANKFQIKHLYMFGSFDKNKQRIDSDIDLLVVFKNNMTYEEKIINVQKFKDYILETFKRYGDLMEFNNSSINKEQYYQIY